MPEEASGLPASPSTRYVRFGPFELDSRSGELRKHGIRIRAGQQTVQILAMLLVHPGELVLREEIRLKLWPLDTVVEFDHSINAAIQKLRDALSDSAADPRYIETLPRRGYRFIGRVEMTPVNPVIEMPASPQAVESTEVRQPERRWTPLAIVAASIVIVVLGSIFVAGLSLREDRAQKINWTLAVGPIPGPAMVSPDGSAVVYRSKAGVFLRHLDSLEEKLVYPAQTSEVPAWSDDGVELLLRSTQGLVRLPLPNGPPLLVWPYVEPSRGVSRALSGPILSATIGNGKGTLLLIPADGGKPNRLEVPGFENGRFYHPEFLPDGKTFLFAWETDEAVDVGLYLATLESGKIARGPVLLRRNMTAGHYSPSGGGNLLFIHDNRLYAQRLNISQGKLEGMPTQLIEGVSSSIETRRPFFSVSRNGVLVWRAGQAESAQLTWFDRKGNSLGTSGPPCFPEVVGLSPDEKYVILFTLTDRPGYNAVEENRGGEQPLGDSTGSPLWLDSSHILISQRDGDGYRILERTVRGDNGHEVARLPGFFKLRDVSADGKVLLYREGKKLYALPLDGSPAQAKSQFVAETVQGKFSPSARWIVYSTIDANGTEEVFVQRFPSGGLRKQLSPDGGSDPVWRRDGKEILYRKGSTIFSLLVEEQGDDLQAKAPVALFQVRVPSGFIAEDMPMAVTRDGSKILFAQATEQPDPQLTYVMTAWDMLLRKGTGPADVNPSGREPQSH